MSDSCVVTQSLIQHRSLFLKVHTIRFEMLTYFVYAPLLNRIGALLSNMIQGLEASF